MIRVQISPQASIKNDKNRPCCFMAKHHSTVRSFKGYEPLVNDSFKVKTNTKKLIKTTCVVRYVKSYIKIVSRYDSHDL